MRKLLQLLFGRSTTAVVLAPGDIDVTPNLALAPDEARLFRQVGLIARRVAAKFGDRQNSPSTLKPREAEEVVTALLNAGNLMCALADRQHPLPKDGNASAPAERL